MKNRVVGYYAVLVLSRQVISVKRFAREVWRLLTFRRHVVTVFLQLDDPYSYLLSHYLQYLREYYEVELRIKLCQALRTDFMPEPAMQAEYAVRDCALLANEYAVPFLDRGNAPAVEFRRSLLDFLAEEEDQEDFADTFHQILSHYWRGDSAAAARVVERIRPNQSDTDVLVAKNQLLLRKMRHYASAMMYYGGEWYWGIDRLMHLCDRLDGLRARRDQEPMPEFASFRQVSQIKLPATVPARAQQLPPIVMYFSFRSPYSYLAMDRIGAIADAFDIKLELRPVLPMVSRGLKLPPSKRRYLVQDALREACKMGVPFGNIRDPLGVGIERCMAAFSYADSQGKARPFLHAASRAIWSGGVDVATDDGMRQVTEEAGLFWPDVVAAMAKNDWQDRVEEHMQELSEIGLWGVPVFTIDQLSIWGQDRLWLFARQIEDMCIDAEGIVV